MAAPACVGFGLPGYGATRALVEFMQLPRSSHVRSAHVFCEVIDNYGDAGVCWRLARALAERGLAVTLWIDDLQRLQRLRPALDTALRVQPLDGFRVRHWREGEAEPVLAGADASSGAVMDNGATGPAADAALADLVIAAFGCRLPQAYLDAMAAMAARGHAPVWINLEYLSAEDWVAHSHGLPSPHPRLRLTEHFYFPGFSRGTGGLLKEIGYDDARRAFDASQRHVFLASLGLQVPDDVPLVSLFCYPHADIAGLFDAMAAGPAVHCLVPEGVSPLAPAAGQSLTVGALTLHGMPFVQPDDYDRLLWSCDLNFVRGEDSAVRAQWAGRPLLWQLYPQDDDAHRAKLDAFLSLHTAGMAPALATLVTRAMRSWSDGDPDRDAGRDPDHGPARSLAPDWPALLAALPALHAHAAQWAAQLGEQRELAAGLIEFADKIG